MNDVQALNVTTQTVNLAKRDATKRFLDRADNDNLRAKPLEECFAQQWRDDGTSHNVGRAIVNTYDDYVYTRFVIHKCITYEAIYTYDFAYELAYDPEYDFLHKLASNLFFNLFFLKCVKRL
jgi:hypothetical protein